MEDELGAFCRHADVRIEGVAEGPLAGLRFAAKSRAIAVDSGCPRLATG